MRGRPKSSTVSNVKWSKVDSETWSLNLLCDLNKDSFVEQCIRYLFRVSLRGNGQI